VEQARQGRNGGLCLLALALVVLHAGAHSVTTTSVPANGGSNLCLVWTPVGLGTVSGASQRSRQVRLGGMWWWIVCGGGESLAE